ncbi:hypothetical protein ACH5RR_022308 [Cinchona calisaya]|uniref:Uncharacterized protein n=1 Tax=Cinchona calisaya TaxID=153742 RepID=A0ABD2Z7E5_9GENT
MATAALHVLLNCDEVKPFLTMSPPTSMPMTMTTPTSMHFHIPSPVSTPVTMPPSTSMPTSMPIPTSMSISMPLHTSMAGSVQNCLSHSSNASTRPVEASINSGSIDIPSGNNTTKKFLQSRDLE